MFRTVKKRGTAATRNRTGEDDDDDEGDTITTNLANASLFQKKKLKNSNRTVVTTTTTSNHGSTGGSGMGFGGGGGITTDNNDNMHLNRSNIDATTVGDREILYDKESLSKLFAEQNTYVIPTETMESGNPSEQKMGKTNSNDISYTYGKSMDYTEQPIQGPAASMMPTIQQNRDEEADLIPLNMEEPTILYGDEAMMFLQREFADSPQGNEDMEPLDVNEDWEEQIARRAGVDLSHSDSQQRQRQQQQQPPYDSHMYNNGLRDDFQDSSTSLVQGKSLALVDQLRTRMKQTAEQLEIQRTEAERRVGRRRGEVQSNLESIQRYEKDLQHTGSALEFYQVWRNKLCAWIGAIRELHEKIDPILSSFHELEGGLSAIYRWEQWENDTISVLEERGCLDQVIGRKPPPVPDTQTVVDEFGRDVKSLHVRRREKRRQHRHRIHGQRRGSASTLTVAQSKYIRGDESDAFVSDGEVEVFRERHDALREALQIALEEVDEEYRVLQNLVDLFEEWNSAYPEEYKECYGSLSLVDLSGVLVQAELCSLNDPWNESEGYNEAKWAAVIATALAKGTVDGVAVERLFEKWIIPVIADLLDKNGLSLVSRRQTRSIKSFMSHIRKLLPQDSTAWRKLRSIVSSYIRSSLSTFAIPIVRDAPQPEQLSFDELDEFEEAMQSARWGQLYRIKKVLMNLLLYWEPFMQNDDDFMDIILDFISNKFLFLLSSLQGQLLDELAESPAEVFSSIYQILVNLGWLEYPEYMLQAAPIRAAAAVYCSD